MIGQAWRVEAACRGMDLELFYPTPCDEATTRAAKAVCAGCVVSVPCLHHALDGGEHYGVWGGVSQEDRHRMAENRRRHRHRTAKAARG